MNHDNFRTPHRLRLRACRRLHAFRVPLTATALLAAALPMSGGAQEGVALTDPGLTRALQEVVGRHNPELALRRAAVEAAIARTGAVGFAPPAVVSGEMEEVPGGFDVADASFRLEIGREFLTSGRSAAARALATTAVRSPEVELLATQRRVAALTLQHVTGVVASSWTARRLAAEDSLLVAVETAVRDRFSVGEARYVDVLRLKTERLRVQTDRAEAIAVERAEREAMLALGGPDGARAVATLLDSAVALPMSATDVVELPPAPPLDSLLALSGHVRLAEAEVARSRAARDLVRAERRPRISASVGVQRVFDNGESSFGPLLGASLTLPFTAGRANRAAVEVSGREIEVAEMALVAAGARARAELASALAHYEAARERFETYDLALLEGARQERESALAAYRTGDMSLLELLDFERALARAEIERLRARADAAEAYATLTSATDSR